MKFYKISKIIREQREIKTGFHERPDHNINVFEFKKNLTGTIVVEVIIHVGYKYELYKIQCKGCSCNLLMDIGPILRMFRFDDGQFW